MNSQSKEYKKLIQGLRYQLKGHLLNDLRRNNPGSPSQPYAKKYRRYLIISATLMILSIALIFIIALMVSRNEIQSRYIGLFFWLSLSALMIIELISAYKARGIMDEYTAFLVESYPDKCLQYTEQLLKSVVEALVRSVKQPNVTQTEKCGCFHCIELFNGDQVIVADGSRKCPFCRNSEVLTESSGYPVTVEFLSAMHDYWLDEE